jgi:hypothetical protein
MDTHESRGQEKPHDLYSWLTAKYGEEKGLLFYCRSQLPYSVFSSWECRDCFVLDEREYFEKLGQRYQEEDEAVKQLESEQMPNETAKEKEIHWLDDKE